jgi:predicted nucleic acid-binding protein
MNNFLIDSNSIVYYYEPSNSYDGLKKTIDNPDNIIHMLEICIPEVIAVFHKKHFGVAKYHKKITKAEMYDFKNTFLNDINNKFKYQIHPVMARDVILTDQIWEKANEVYNKTPEEKRHEFLGSIDALLLTLAMNLSKTQGLKNNFTLITNDCHMYETAKALNLKVLKPVELK